MPRDAWGADWGRYRRHKAAIMRCAREKRRTQRVNVVYLLRRVDRRLAWFGEPQLVAKVGRSSRSAYQRVVDLRSRCYELVAYWTVAREDLPRAELIALHAMKAVFGAPCDGKEAFTSTPWNMLTRSWRHHSRHICRPRPVADVTISSCKSL